ncbi:MAG: PepSY domain-containing protein [Pseudomonadota bacterium]
MKKNIIIGGVIAGFLATAGAVAAQSTAPGEPPALTTTQAIEIALAEVPGTVQETELDREDGVQVYEIEILNGEGQEMEVLVSADTGEVLEVELDEKDCKKGRDA